MPSECSIARLTFPPGVLAVRMLIVITYVLMQIRAGICSQPPSSPQLRRD